MKAKIWVSALSLVALFGFSAYKINTTDDRNELVMRLLMESTRVYHYSTLKIDDKFSEEVYDLYLKRIDPSKRYLTKGDLDKFASYKRKLDDEINVANYEFFNISDEVLMRRVEQIQEFSKEILEKPFDFNKDENIVLKSEAVDFAKDKDELKKRCYEILKYQTLQRYADLLSDQEKALARKDTVFKQKSEKELEADARAKVLKLQNESYQRWLKITVDERRSNYLNTIINIYDPHSTYFPPDDKQDFDIRMSGKLEGIGATLQEKDGFIKITSIVPGSPSARQGDLKENDAIIKVAQGAGEPVDIEGWRTADAIKLIRGKKGTEVRLTVKKPDGTIKVIPIIRDVVILEATYAKSLVLQDSKSESRVGYIYLPQFYADFQDRNGARCAVDVRKEIEKLKAENVNGIILDLRNNGGGSLSDVVDMTGFFIEKGPVVQVKARDASPKILADENPALQYDGKFVVMVNQFSASASEILAAAIQDYKRGVIVGTPTHGKGTVQRIYDLDDVVPNRDSDTHFGAIKITTQKFYRINGGATQLKGVTPDIVLPDVWANLELGEKEQEHYMQWDEIKPVSYEMWKVPANIEALKRNSKKRVEGNPMFKAITEVAKNMKEQDDKKEWTMNIKKYREQQQKQKEQSDRLEKEMEKDIPELKIFNLKADESKINSDSTHLKIHEKWVKDRKQDAQLYETLQIINEM